METILVDYKLNKTNGTLTISNKNNIFEVSGLDYFYGCLVEENKYKFRAYFGPPETKIEDMEKEWFSENLLSFDLALKELLDEAWDTYSLDNWRSYEENFILKVIKPELI